MPEGPRTSPGVHFPPPFLFVGGVVLAALLQRAWPLPLWRGLRSTIPLVVAYLLIAAGFAWATWGIMTFRRARTAVIPNHPASRLVTWGPYRFGRNPMYLGLTILYCGVAVWMNSLWAFLLLPLVIALLIGLVIRRQERYLTDAFGQAYRDYCGRVPRWISFGAVPLSRHSGESRNSERYAPKSPGPPPSPG